MNRRRDLVVPSVVLDQASAAPLHRQIERQLADSIRGGAIPGGVRLPASRVLARLLGVSRNTVLAAYDDLAAAGLIAGERGAGMRVQGAPVPALTMSGLRQVIRDAGYPSRTVTAADPDGNPLYFRF